MAAPPDTGLPAYADYVSHVESAPRARARWPFVVFIVLGLVLMVAPLATGMFPRAAKGEAMIGSFAPYQAQSSIESYRADLETLEEARGNILALRAHGQESGQYQRIDQFVSDYPGIRADMTEMIDAIDANRGNYDRLAALPPFGILPWLLALPGLVLVLAGIFGYRRARDGKPAVFQRSLAALAGLVLIAVPASGGLFSAASAAQPLIDGFRPILTHEEVRTVQSYFVTLVAADGELNSRYTAAVRTAYPDADLTGITALEFGWQPMTARFASLIGAMNDNVTNFDAVVALNNATKPFGFTAFRALGWFFLIPGVVALAVALSGVRLKTTGAEKK